MAALAVNLMSMERLLNPGMTQEYFDQKASFLARLGAEAPAAVLRVM
jgi:diphosphomevalonate decarboxylase